MKDFLRKRFMWRPEGGVWINQEGRRCWEHRHRQRRYYMWREGGGRAELKMERHAGSKSWRALWATVNSDIYKLLEYFKNYLTYIWGIMLSTVDRMDWRDARMNKPKGPARRLLNESKWRWRYSGLRRLQWGWRKAGGFEKYSEVLGVEQSD